ncbi:MAG TPA: hypothetical protein VD967_02180 [Candidatus Paceibacterota bacterium]|nr:hypothetical protein [Candidatus Paceibacterota bacterium]
MSVLHFFDKLEDYVRTRLSRYPITYAFVGGVGVVLFWRGIWMMADEMAVSSIGSVLLSLVILLLTGLFVSFFVGDAIIISGLKRDKKLIEKTEAEVDAELDAFKHMKEELDQEMITLAEIKRDIADLKDAVSRLPR